MQPVIISVTGPVGSGKTTVCKMISEMIGSVYLDSDKLVKSLYDEDADLKSFLRNKIGREVISLDGRVVSNILFREIFSCSKKRRELEMCVYPVLKRKILNIIEGSESRYFVVEGVKLKEASILDISRIVISVISSHENIWRRLSEKGLPTYKIMSLIEAQKKFYEYYDEADCLIINNGSLADLKKKVEYLVKKMIENGIVQT
ncbi:MAG: dephospho-CoA kinase [Actinobacteria bacterium]|nr:dephospho-CoA kinase [Actinomycetota bacterium]